MLFLFLLSYQNTHGSLRELEKDVEMLTCGLMFLQHFAFSQTSSGVPIT